MELGEQDWLLRFLSEFASMSEEDRDAAIDGLSPVHRSALVALAQARAATAHADLIEVLDAGQAGLEKLHELEEPAELFTVINPPIAEHPNIVVEALFAAVVLHRGWDEGEPPAIVELREGWHWHLHERMEAAREGDGSSA